MQPQVIARHFEADPVLRQYAADRLNRLERYYDGINDARVILSGSADAGSDKCAEITLSVYRQRLAARHAAGTHEEAINFCVERLRKQLMRYKAKLRNTSKNIQH